MIAKRVRLVRKARGLKKSELDHMAGLSNGVVSSLEGGRRASAPSAQLVLQLARALDVDVGWLITGIVPDGRWRPPMGVSRPREEPEP